MNKKGQVNIAEFLLTYGWVILLVLIVIGILAYYLNPSDITPEIKNGIFC